jgi:hypothetical protein
MPASLEDAEACGFTSTEFSSAGHLDYSDAKAWAVSFARKGEYWTALSIGAAMAFLYFALASARRIGARAAASSAMGGGLLALAAVCLSCLAPVLSVVGLGVAASALAGIPKWLLALNTLLITSWGTLFIAPRLAACPLNASECSD